MLNEIKFLLWKEIKLEWRQRFAFNGIVLYLLSTLFTVYISSFNLNEKMWIGLFWIILLFASVNAVAKSFIAESKNRLLYFYTITNPVAMLLSKMVYNIMLMLLLSAVGLFFYCLILGNPVQSFSFFLLVVFLGSISFSLCFTMMSAVASKANNNTTLMVILSFPIIIPVLLVLIKLSVAALSAYADFPVKDLFILIGVDVILLLMAIILFPYLWHD